MRDVVLPELPKARRRQYSNIDKVLVPEEGAQEDARATAPYMGLSREQCSLLVGRMLRIGVTQLRKKVKVVNGVFGVWKTPKGRPSATRRWGAPLETVAPKSQ